MSSTVQDDEIAALRAIYDRDYQQAEGAETSYSILIHSEENTLSLELCVSLPMDYPEVSPPIYQLKDALWLTGEDREHIAKSLQSIFRESRGEVVVYQWVEWLREYLKAKEQKRSKDGLHSSSTPKEGQCCMDSTANGSVASSPDMVIVHGEPVTFKRSTFQAHVASIRSLDEVKAVLTQLKTNKKIAAATHNILAYRICSGSPGVFQQDFDNDGESGAGTILLHLLQIIDAQNIAVVVTRWFGGVLLHNDRFKYIKNVARELIVESGVGLQHQDSKLEQEKSTSGKKKRTKSK